MSILNNTSSLVVTRSERIGLTVVAISYKGQSTFAPPADLRLAFEAHLFSENPALGLKASNKKRFNALWAGSGEELSTLRRMYNQKPAHMPRVDLVSLGDFEDNWLNGPGYNSIAKQVEAKVGLVTFFCTLQEGITPLAAANLAKLRQQAHQNACHVIAFVVVPEVQLNANELRGMADRIVVIKPCEPDPDWSWAVSAEFVSQGYFGVTRPKTMCQLTSSGKGYPQAVFEPHLHDELVTRVQWHMRKHGAMNKDIAQAFDVSGSTITRALQHLPKYPKSWKSEEEVKSLLAFVMGEDTTPAASKKGTQWGDSDLDDDDDEDVDLSGLDDDDDALYLPKKTSKLNKRR